MCICIAVLRCCFVACKCTDLPVILSINHNSVREEFQEVVNLRAVHIVLERTNAAYSRVAWTCMKCGLLIENDRLLTEFYSAFACRCSNLFSPRSHAFVHRLVERFIPQNSRTIQGRHNAIKSGAALGVTVRSLFFSRTLTVEHHATLCNHCIHERVSCHKGWPPCSFL